MYKNESVKLEEKKLTKFNLTDDVTILKLTDDSNVCMVSMLKLAR